MPVSFGIRHTPCRLPDWECSTFITAWTLEGRKLPNSQGLQHSASLSLQNLAQFAKTSEISLTSLLLLLLDSFYAQSRCFNCLDVESRFYCVFYRPQAKIHFYTLLTTCLHRGAAGLKPTPGCKGLSSTPKQLLQSPFFRQQQGSSLQGSPHDHWEVLIRAAAQSQAQLRQVASSHKATVSFSASAIQACATVIRKMVDRTKSFSLNQSHLCG